MTNRDLLLQTYEKNKNRVKEFLEQTKTRTDEHILGELYFCLMTPQSKAKYAREAVNRLKKEGLLFTVELAKLKEYLRFVRFGDKKAGYIVKSRELFPTVKARLDEEPRVLREWLAGKTGIKGFGLKESSHFLRNIGIGFGELAIIDVHVRNFLQSIGLSDEKPITKKTYQELEEKFLELSKQLEIPPEELDIAIWLYQSGESEFYG